MKLVLVVLYTLLALAMATVNPTLERMLRQANQLGSTMPEGASTTSEPKKSYLQCRTDYDKMICKYGYQNTVLNMYISCGQNEQAMTLAGQCDRKTDGGYCLESYLADLEHGQGVDLRFQSMANRQCLSAIENSEESCSEGCHDALSVLKTHYGCCINSILNVTTNASQLYTYELWSKCNIESPGTCRESASINLVHDVPVCTDDELLYKELRDLRCTSGNRFILDKMSTEIEGCDEFITLNKQWCLTNTQGAFCTEISELTATLVREVYKNCSSAQTKCPTNCKTVLETLKDELGCCIDSTYDSAYFLSFGERINLLDDSLWTQCDITPPLRVCTNMLDGATHSQAHPLGIFVAGLLMLAVQRILT